jgi:hypothetical protein
MVSHAVAGILHVQIVLSHWSMHSYEGRAYTGADDEWHITTMRTTMNVATPPPLDFVHIGLQFQVEHHLYPRLPRHNLRIARDMVKEVVDKHFPPGSDECKRLFPCVPASRSLHPSGWPLSLSAPRSLDPSGRALSLSAPRPFDTRAVFCLSFLLTCLLCAVCSLLSRAAVPSCSPSDATD